MNRGPLWPRVLRSLIGASNPLPGTLCDETPQVPRSAFDSFRDRCRTCNAPISFGFQPPTRSKADARWVHDEPAADGHKAAPTAGRWQPAIPVHEVPEPRDDGEYDQGAEVGNAEYAATRARDIAEARAFDRAMQAVTDGPVTAYLRHLLDEITADRDQLSAANGLLVAKVRELTAALGHDTTGA